MFWLLHKPKSGSGLLFIHAWMIKKARVARKLKEGFECLIFEEVTVLIFLSLVIVFLGVLDSCLFLICKYHATVRI